MIMQFFFYSHKGGACLLYRIILSWQRWMNWLTLVFKYKCIEIEFNWPNLSHPATSTHLISIDNAGDWMTLGKNIYRVGASFASKSLTTHFSTAQKFKIST